MASPSKSVLGYQIIDEPRASGLSAWATQPWPPMMIAAIFSPPLGMGWMLLNGFALGARNMGQQGLVTLVSLTLAAGIAVLTRWAPAQAGFELWLAQTLGAADPELWRKLFSALGDILFFGGLIWVYHLQSATVEMRRFLERPLCDPWMLFALMVGICWLLRPVIRDQGALIALLWSF
ncbi:MAG: hypothetical protein MRY63_05760 [Neomegalonema sp.]|nr:hypothetical protein [Neomegalonema sp.]